MEERVKKLEEQVAKLQEAVDALSRRIVTFGTQAHRELADELGRLHAAIEKDFKELRRELEEKLGKIEAQMANIHAEGT